ncbi:YSIRK-type signal peptide-containing protein [Staphylococcus pasteuri]
MNLFRKRKFSIRKFNIGIFSTIIGTTLFFKSNSSSISRRK